MKKYILFLLVFVVACVPPPSPVEPFKPPPVKGNQVAPLEPSLLERDLLTEYDIWEFLKSKPDETEVLELLGYPDSVWVSDEEPYYVLYYYIPELKDYNAIVFNQQQRRVTGYEWDE
ncbi:MAG: hypothetical protein ACE5D2_01240 [Fidelibacterota bacterium]